MIDKTSVRTSRRSTPQAVHRDMSDIVGHQQRM